jgi:hypothetical protein
MRLVVRCQISLVRSKVGDRTLLKIFHDHPLFAGDTER